MNATTANQLVETNHMVRRLHLTSALLMAVTAPTEEQAERAVLLAGAMASRLDPATVKQCQAEAKRMIQAL